jgi:hypothetical protein
MTFEERNKLTIGETLGASVVYVSNRTPRRRTGTVRTIERNHFKVVNGYDMLEMVDYANVVKILPR